MDTKLTREEFIEELKRRIIYENLPIGDALEEAVNYNVDFPDWVDMDKRLPPPNGNDVEFPDLSKNCLFVDEYDNVREGWYDHTEKRVIFNDRFAMTMNAPRITHWIPMLPLPNKEKKGE